MHNVKGTWGQTQDNTTAQSTRVPVHNFASILDPKVTEQVSLTANIPSVAPHVALMPDAHYGLGSSVGNKIARKHVAAAKAQCKAARVKLPTKDLAYLEEGTPEFHNYLTELHWAQ